MCKVDQGDFTVTLNDTSCSASGVTFTNEMFHVRNGERLFIHSPYLDVNSKAPTRSSDDLTITSHKTLSNGVLKFMFNLRTDVSR